jgi:hypothetical protein
MTHCLGYHHVTGHLVFVLVCTEFVIMCDVDKFERILTMTHGVQDV